MDALIATGFCHEDHVGAGGKERFRPDDRRRACGTRTYAEPVLIEKHGRCVVMVIAVEEYERLTVRPDAPRKTVGQVTEATKK